VTKRRQWRSLGKGTEDSVWSTSPRGIVVNVVG
jgi:hypothetical protein